MARIAFRNFTGGEVTPTLSARYDLQKFGTFLQCCQNFVPNLHGDIERRAGTRFVAELGAASVLVQHPEMDRARQETLLKEIIDDSDWLVRMVENLLSVTRIDADKVRLSKHSTVLPQV